MDLSEGSYDYYLEVNRRPRGPRVDSALKPVARLGRVYHRSDVRTVLRLRPYQSSS